MGKIKKQFKEKILLNKITSEKKRNNFLDKRIIKFEIDSITAEVDRGKLLVSQEELKEIIKDLIYTNTAIKEDSIIELDKICNVYYKLACESIQPDKMIFSLC